ncbi:MBL fold metallo-hydrolase [Salinarchaeum chitinilyticum]
MSTSDWGDWLVREIEAADPDGLAAWYLGCNGFVVKAGDGTTIWIDPYVGLGDPPRTVRMIPVPFDPGDVEAADAILATHEHTDHVHGPSQAPILEQTDAAMYAPDDSLAVAREEENWQTDYDVEDQQFVEIEEGDEFEIGDVTVHVEHANDADATHPVAYVVEFGDATLFHGGDTKPSERFTEIGETYDVDLGILAFGTIGNIDDKETGAPNRTKWYNTENEIVEAASDLQFDRLLPSHWDMWRGLTSDPKVLHHHAKSFAYPRDLEIVEIGDRVDV